MEQEFKPNTKYHVKHIPSGEEWLVLGVSKDLKKVCAAGWPPSIGDVEDCENFEEAGILTDEESNYRTAKFGNNWI